MKSILFVIHWALVGLGAATLVVITWTALSGGLASWSGPRVELPRRAAADADRPLELARADQRAAAAADLGQHHPVAEGDEHVGRRASDRRLAPHREAVGQQDDRGRVGRAASPAQVAAERPREPRQAAARARRRNASSTFSSPLSAMVCRARSACSRALAGWSRVV